MPRHVNRFVLLLCLCSGLSFPAGFARADDAPSGEFASKTSGLTVGTTFTYDGGPTGESSEALTVASESSGTRSFGRRHGLFQWDTSGGVRAGYAQGYPGPFIGVQTDLSMETGVRPYDLKGCWSPYVGVGGRFTTSPVWILSQTPLVDYIDNLNKAGGSALTGSARVSLGASCVTASHVVLLYGFAQNAYRAPAGLAYPTASDYYNERGTGFRLDDGDLRLVLELSHSLAQSSDPNAELGEAWSFSTKLSRTLPHHWTLEVIGDLSRYDVKPAGEPASPATLGFTGKVSCVTPL